MLFSIHNATHIMTSATYIVKTFSEFSLCFCQTKSFMETSVNHSFGRSAGKKSSKNYHLSSYATKVYMRRICVHTMYNRDTTCLYLKTWQRMQNAGIMSAEQWAVSTYANIHDAEWMVTDVWIHSNKFPLAWMTALKNKIRALSPFIQCYTFVCCLHFQWLLISIAYCAFLLMAFPRHFRFACFFRVRCCCCTALNLWNFTEKYFK